MTPQAAIGERVRRLRLAADVSQTDLASALGHKSNGVISKLEHGRVFVDESVLETIAQRLDCTTDFLTRPAPDVFATKPMLRAYADARTRTVDAVLADNVIAHEIFGELGLKRVPDTIPIYDATDLDDVESIESFAQEVRAAADLPEGAVVRNMMRAAERLGCVIMPLDDELGRHLGLSQRLDSLPYIRASRPRTTSARGVPGDRQRFTVAHEVGHLALHSHLRPPETAEAARHYETQAHRFAAAFLTPAGPLLDDWHGLGGRVTLTALSQLKANWGASIKMLVGRFRDLGVIDADQAVSLYKQISRRGWNTGEPVPVPNEEPIWLRRAAERLPAVGVGLEAAVANRGLGRSHPQRWTDWSDGDGDADADVIDLPRSSSSHASESDREAEILRLKPRV